MEEKQRNAKRSDHEWITLIQECRTSGLGDKDWCSQHGIPISSFYTKITKLRRKVCEIPDRNETSNTGESPAVILRINDYSIEISNHAARNTILNALSALQQLC